LSIILNSLNKLIICSIFFLIPIQTIAQKDILELLPGSEILEYNEANGFHRLIGNVNFIYQNNLMYCDSAHYFEKNQIVRAYGKVHINKNDTLNFYCDSLFFDGKKGKSILWGNVRVIDNEYKLLTDTLKYDSKKTNAYYQNGGKVINTVTKETLTSKIGYFHPKSKNFFFSYNVLYKGKNSTIQTDTLQYIYNEKKAIFLGKTDIQNKNTKMYCESGWYKTNSEEGSLIKNAYISRQEEYISGDTLIYDSKKGISIGKGNIYYTDLTQKLEFNGEYAYTSDSLNYSFITGNAIATKIMKDDTLYLHADTLIKSSLDSINIIKAYKNSKVFSTKVQCVADSIVYKSNSMKLYDNPIVWSYGAELKGDFIEISINDSIIDSINIQNNSSILMEIEPNLYYNQISGKNIIAYFKENKLYKTYVKGNAITLFYPEEEIRSDSTLTKKRIGMNRLYSSNLRIDIKNNKIKGINYIQSPDGVFYPIEKIKKEEKFIQNFVWKEALRPKTKEEILIEKN
tara:strand:+ start:39492 stop:41030 length:1539 start_codon:yes stop_codon:yes gene_type:complete